MRCHGCGLRVQPRGAVRIDSRTRLGLTYISEVDLVFKDDLRFKNLDGTLLGGILEANGLMDSRLKIESTIPSQVALGVYHAFTDKLAMVGSVNWQDWSKFGEPEIAVAESDTYFIHAINLNLVYRF